MSATVDYQARLKKVQDAMSSADIDVLVATRLSTVGYIFGSFVPWRGVAIISREGEPRLYVAALDAERVKDDSFFKSVIFAGPLPGMALWDQVLSYLRASGAEKGRIGIEMGHSPIRVETFLLASEYELLKEAFPQAVFGNATHLLNEIFIIKDEAEVECFRRAAEICDLGMEAVIRELKVGMTETEVAGIAEYAMRKAGSELNWSFTGGQEIAAGSRTAYSWGGCTPPTRRQIEVGDNVVIDLHSMYNMYLGDLSRNAIMGAPTSGQQELADAFVATCNVLIQALKPGATYGGVARQVDAFLDDIGYRQYALPGYGHGIGIIGNEWYPVVANSSVPYESSGDLALEPNMIEVAAVVLNKPGVGGMRMETPVLITPGGCEPLNKVPFEPAMIKV